MPERSINLPPAFDDPACVRAAIVAAVHNRLCARQPVRIATRAVQLLEELYLVHHAAPNPVLAREALHAGVVALYLRGTSSVKAQPPVARISHTEAGRLLDQVFERVYELNVDDTVLGLATLLSDSIPVVAAHGPTHRVLASPVNGRDSETKRYGVLHEPLALPPLPDVDHLEHTLSMEFPWFQHVIRRVANEVRLGISLGRDHFQLRPLLLVGPPGNGKTRLARRLAELAGVPYQVVPCAGSSDSMSLRGTARGWSSARPGAVLELIARTRCPCPIVVLDELDKAGTSRRNGRLIDVALQLLEPETARAYYDECLEQPCDLSRVTYVALVNELGPLPEPLRDRFLILSAGAPTAEHFDALLDGVLADLAAEYSVHPHMFPALTIDDRDLLRRACALNPRRLARATRMLIADRLATSRNPRPH